MGILKKIPLSNDPSPNCLEETSVNEAKTPNSVPFIKDLENSKVTPSSQLNIPHRRSWHQMG